MSRPDRAPRSSEASALSRLRDAVAAAGSGLAEHNSPGEATLHVLRGRVRLTTPDLSAEAAAGDLLLIPPQRHALAALDDSAVLLTVALGRG